MAIIRNLSGYPVQLASYMQDQTKFGNDGGVIYPGECRYVNADNFHWDTCIIAAFTDIGVVPNQISIQGNIEWGHIGLTVNLKESTAMAAAIIGQHTFFEFHNNNGMPIFIENESASISDCKVTHGW
jgi:hypothetical protein